MIENYTEKVFADYKKRKFEKSLSINLVAPTPAGLRDECLKVYAEKKLPKEDVVLRSFFGPLSDSEKDYSHRIENHDIDKYRPLIHFMDGETKNPNKKVVELLEWLMGFQPSIDNTKFNIPKKYYKAIIAFVASLVVVIGSFVAYHKSSQQCMYWNGDHYEPIACDEKAKDATIIALDTFKVLHQKKITTPDTLTQKALGKVWYVKIAVDSAEFYTSKGDYPLDNRKRLLPVTDYILEKYVFNQQKPQTH